MAQNVIAQVIGGSKKVFDDAKTVGDVRTTLGASGMAAKVNAQDQSDDYSLEDGDIVTFSNKPKGGN